MPHVWHLFVGMIPEAEESLREIANFIETTTRDPSESPVGEVLP
jgi:hypothetical protein